MRRFLLIPLFLFSVLRAAEQPLRVCTSGVGTTIEAKFVAEKMGYIRLEKADGSLITVKLDQLCSADQEYVEKATEVRGRTEIEGIAAKPGAYSERITCGGGANVQALNRYKEGAELLGCILAMSVESKNGFPEAEDAMEAMVADVYNRLPIAEGLSFSTGFSGGSRAAYLLAEGEKNTAGVLACGSGCGVYQKMRISGRPNCAK